MGITFFFCEYVGCPREKVNILRELKKTNPSTNEMAKTFMEDILTGL